MDSSSCRNSANLRLKRCLLAIVVAAAYLVAEPSPAEKGRRRRDLGDNAQVNLALFSDATGATYFASLRNASAKPLFIVIGTITANDKWLCPDRIELLITGPHGKANRSRSSFGCKPSGGIAGRMDPLFIPLAAGASYSLPVLDLRGAPAGRYIVKARYAGISIPLSSSNLDMQGLSLIHYWTAAVESNTLTANIQ